MAEVKFWVASVNVTSRDDAFVELTPWPCRAHVAQVWRWRDLVVAAQRFGFVSVGVFYLSAACNRRKLSLTSRLSTPSTRLVVLLLFPRKRMLMNLTISGHHLEITASMREYVLTKLDRVTRHFDQVVDINVLLSFEKLKEKERRQKAEVTLHVKGKDIFVETSHEDMYAAIDNLMDKLDRQVCRHKDKLQNHHHIAAKRLDATLA
jgi:putative sigma-54 modulation protein